MNLGSILLRPSEHTTNRKTAGVRSPALCSMRPTCRGVGHVGPVELGELPLPLRRWRSPKGRSLGLMHVAQIRNRNAFKNPFETHNHGNIRKYEPWTAQTSNLISIMSSLNKISLAPRNMYIELIFQDLSERLPWHVTRPALHCPSLAILIPPVWKGRNADAAAGD